MSHTPFVVSVIICDVCIDLSQLCTKGLKDIFALLKRTAKGGQMEGKELIPFCQHSMQCPLLLPP